MLVKLFILIRNNWVFAVICLDMCVDMGLALSKIQNGRKKWNMEKVMACHWLGSKSCAFHHSCTLLPTHLLSHCYLFAPSEEASCHVVRCSMESPIWEETKEMCGQLLSRNRFQFNKWILQNYVSRLGSRSLVFLVGDSKAENPASPHLFLNTETVS